MFEKFFKPKAEPSEYDIMQQELLQVNARINAVRREYEMVEDSNLVEGLIFELQSLTHRQSYLYEQLKSKLDSIPSCHNKEGIKA